jgi:(methylthio)acryloyl-CoA hydratase
MLLDIQTDGHIAIIMLNRADKRNALSDAMIAELHAAFLSPPAGARALVVAGSGGNFCAGLDLSELKERDAVDGVAHSRSWHAAFNALQFGSMPVVAAIDGACIGGGMELALSCHVRVADTSAYFALPEATRGIFTGGGASVRLSKLIGASRVTEMMLTGRVLDAQEGRQLGLSHYSVEPGAALTKACELAHKIAGNSPVSNHTIMHALPRIADLPMDSGLLMESLASGVAQSSPDAKARVRAFLEKRAPKVGQW